MSPDVTSLHNAIIQTLTYADIFDYPLTAPEIHRYLIGIRTSLDIIEETLANGLYSSRQIVQNGHYFTLPGREGLAEIRLRRAAQSSLLWPHALRYGAALADFPYVRMVALTGALAVNNVEGGADVDYFIVTEPGRLWLCRALIIGLVRVAARQGVVICPNFFLAENALELPDRNLYVAREVTQMIPLSGMEIYRRIQLANPWVYEILPNAGESPMKPHPNWSLQLHTNAAKKVVETLLSSSLGAMIEKWEMNRKIRKFTTQFPNTAETRFSADRCQGHFDGYGKKTMESFRARLDTLQISKAYTNSHKNSELVGTHRNR